MKPIPNFLESPPPPLHPAIVLRLPLKPFNIIYSRNCDVGGVSGGPSLGPHDAHLMAVIFPAIYLWSHLFMEPFIYGAIYLWGHFFMEPFICVAIYL